MLARPFLLWILLPILTSCAQPQWQLQADEVGTPRLLQDHIVMADGYRLPLSITVTVPQDRPRAILLGLHGFNDYHNAFRAPAAFFADHGVLTVAYDQRGFGATEQRGLWPGHDVLTSDAVTIASLVCAAYPGIPLFLLGESMGGAIALQAMQAGLPDCVHGVILAAPAVWGWSAMPWWQALVLRTAAHLLPGKTVTGEGLDITPSDNVEMLRALGRDPLVIKATRIDTIYGLTDLMELASRPALPAALPVLLLYGEQDQIIPPGAMCDLLDRLRDAQDSHWSMALYPQGYHMLTRDLQAEVVFRDILSWLLDREARLPSGQSVVLSSSGRVAAMCGTGRSYLAG